MAKLAYLTFDDGPSNNTVKILEILNFYQIKATFFVIGRTSNYHRNLYKRIVDEGHAIGNHTYSHDYTKVYASVSDFNKDFFALENLLFETTGYKADIFRFPGGSNNTLSRRYGGSDIVYQIAKDMKARGYDYFDWNVTSGDCDFPDSRDWIVDAVLESSRSKQQALILLHDSYGHDSTVEALPEIIVGLEQQGFKFAVLKKHSIQCKFRIS